MRNVELQALKPRIFKFVCKNWQTFFLVFLLVSALLPFSRVSAQNSAVKQTETTLFRNGERLNYNLTLGKFKNAGVAETFVASSGKIGDKNAVELQSRIKTTEFVSAAFYLLDESRTTFASAETGLPLYVRKTSNAAVLPQETISNFLTNPTTNFDLLTLIYQARYMGGVGSFPLLEDEKNYVVNFQRTGSEKFKNELGEFDTNISTVQSQYFTDIGISEVRINFTNDDAKIPVLFRFKTAKGELIAEISGIQGAEIPVSQTPVVIKTPVTQVTPKPIATPMPYIDNEPLSTDLPFVLGETLVYQITANGRIIGNITIQAKERKLVKNQDSLLLTATVSSVQPNQQILTINDSMQTYINLGSFSPHEFTIRLNSLFSIYNQSVDFDQTLGKARLNGTNLVDVPVGTHNLLSLVYAIRAFNLKPIIMNNVVVDTRVAVWLGSTASVFILRPSNAESINLNGERVQAQMINISTGIPQIDMMNLQPRIWLSNDSKRIPLRLIVGSYRSEEHTNQIIQPK